MSRLVDPVVLGRWLDERELLPGAGEPEVSVLGEGHSNLTFLVRRGGDELVLRRPPRGPLLPTAHDVVREARVIELLQAAGHAVPVPAVAGICTDDSVLGVPFYVMERAPGVVVRGALPEFMAGAAGHAARRDIGAALPTALGAIHSVDWQPFVEAGIGKPAGYLERQLRRWVGQREGIQSAVAAAGGTARELPDYDAVRDWLREQVPAESEPAVVHGDYKLDNVIVAPTDDGARIAAVVDWEMATVGDPRADLGYLLSFWAEPGEEVAMAGLAMVHEGFPSRAEVVELWERSTGRVAGDMRWFVALAVWKLAILLEANYHRWLAGLSEDPFYESLEAGVPALLARARSVSGA